MLRKLITFTILFSSCSLLVSSLSGCSSSSKSTSPIKRTELLMGTPITLTLYDTQDTTLLDESFAHIAQLENDLSLNKSGTLLTSLNAKSGKESLVVTDALYDIVSRGLYYSELTSGAFDMTVGPLVKLWSIGLPEARIPSEAEIQATLPLINYQRVVLDEATQSIYLTQEGMALDLGSIAKGYTADAVASFLKDKGVAHAIIDLGGNIYTLGTKPDGSMWRVGVQDPFNPRNNIVGSIEVANKSIVTSGIYERYYEENGVKYHHLLDPTTGYPFDNELAGVTIISDLSIDGDALSTSVFALGLEEGMSFIESIEGVDAIFITKDYKIYITKGLQDSFSFAQEGTFTLIEH